MCTPNTYHIGQCAMKWTKDSILKQIVSISWVLSSRPSVAKITMSDGHTMDFIKKLPKLDSV